MTKRSAVQIGVLPVAALVAAAVAIACGQAPASVVAVPFTVEVNPQVDLPAGATLGLVGNHTSLGATAARPEGDPRKALWLRQTLDDKWVGAAWLPPGQDIDYTVYMLNPAIAPELRLDGSVPHRTVDWTKAELGELARVETFVWPRPPPPCWSCITFIVTVPANTPSGDTIYITGNDGRLGPWNPGKQALTKSPDGTYGVRLLFDPGKALEYKYVRNRDWAFVEKNADGSERPNRTLTVFGTVTQFDVVEKWADR